MDRKREQMTVRLPRELAALVRAFARRTGMKQNDVLAAGVALLVGRAA